MSESAKLQRSKRLLCEVFGGDHHVAWPRFKVEAFDQASYTFACDCATFDGDLLTALVVAAHAHCIRVEIRPGGPGRLKLFMSPRQRTGSLYERHPTLTGHLARLSADPDRDLLAAPSPTTEKETTTP